MARETVNWPPSEKYAAWKKRQESLSLRIKLMERFELKLNELLTENGYTTYEDYLRDNANLVAEMAGKPPPKDLQSHRRRTKEDEQEILELVKAGVRNKDIARRLGFAENTISNVKKVLKDRGDLRCS